LKRIVDDWIRLADTEGVTLPPPERTSKYSGRFVLRVPAPVHQALALKARAAGKSLNSYCAERLAAL
jgi:predicted HicB family RNase H-like nuclease